MRARRLETAPVGDVLRAPAHPYTRLLLDSLPTQRLARCAAFPATSRVWSRRRPAAASIRAARAPRRCCRRAIRPPSEPAAGHTVRCHHPHLAAARMSAPICWNCATSHTHFPIHNAWGLRTGWLRAVDGVSLSVGTRRDPRRRRRIRLRQDDARQDHRGHSRAERRQHPFRGQRDRPACRRARAAALRTRLAVLLPGSGRVARSALEDRPRRWRSRWWSTPTLSARRAAAPRARGARRRSACRKRISTSIRTRSAAASNAASAWRAS